MRAVPFMYAPKSWWEAWWVSSIEAVVGLLLLLALLLWHFPASHFLWFTPSTEHERLALWASKMLLGWTLVMVPVLPLYYLGGSYFRCGKACSPDLPQSEKPPPWSCFEPPEYA